MTDVSPLFALVRFGAIEAKNRILMAPLTRNRAHDDGTPAELAVEYYRQRAGAGLIITEATQISPEGKGYIKTPGMHQASHVAGWRKITDAVHEAGGAIVLQLWHVGRISHTSLQPGGAKPVAPSAVKANAQTYIETGFADVSEPRALEEHEIPRVIRDYAEAARLAKEAGFDGVEVHAANGYLIDQFLHDNVNKRTDAWGGSARNRARFLFEVVDAVSGVWGANRVGVRLSPTGTFSDVHDSDREGTFSVVYDGLNERGLAYLHVVEKFAGAGESDAEQALLDRLRKRWTGPYIANGEFDGPQAAAWVAKSRVDAVAFGRPFIANPDLPARIKAGGPFNTPDQATFYGGDARGYVDYPRLEEAA